MNLSPQDADLFYKLMWPLQFYVNQQRQIEPDIDSVEEYRDLLIEEEKMEVRDALYEHIDLIDDFVSKNPAGLSTEELTIVSGWKRFVAGEFYIERFLKKAAYFIDSKERATVYAVLGIYDSVEEIFSFYQKPPILVGTVLLPFKGRIIYDGMLSTYNIFFGSGIRGNLREMYMAAKQNGRIVESLGPYQPRGDEKLKQGAEKDWSEEIGAIVKSANKLKGQGVPMQSEVFTLLKASARLAQAAVQHPDDIDALWKEQKKVQRALGRLETVLYHAEM